MVVEKVEAEVGFVDGVGDKGFEGRDHGKVEEA